MDGASSHKFFILDPIKYNSFLRNLMNNSEKTILEDTLWNHGSLSLTKMNKIQDIICKESDLVFGNAETDLKQSTVLNLNIGNNNTEMNNNYILLFGADKCILDSSFINGKSIKINIRIIHNLKSSIEEIYHDKVCDCFFKRGSTDEGGQNEFEVNCNSDSNIENQEKQDYLEIRGVNALDEVDLIKPPIPTTEKNIEIRREYKAKNSERVLTRPNINPNHDETLKTKINDSNFSKFFWETSSGFFGEGQEAENRANIEYCKSQSKNVTCENEEMPYLEKEFRKSCTNKEHQLILDTLLIIVNKLVEYLDNM